MKSGYPGLVACAVLLCTLSACGFHLRRPPDLPAQLQVIYISGNTGGNNTALLRSLRRDLAAGNTQVVDDPTLATSILKITDVTRSSSLLAVSNGVSRLNTRCIIGRSSRCWWAIRC